jgi:hypothetical protein
MDMGGKSCRFIGQPSQMVHSFDSSYHILVVGHPKSMNLMMLMVVMVVVVVMVMEEEEEEDGREGRILWRGMRGSKFQANIVRDWLGKAAVQPRAAGSIWAASGQYLGCQSANDHRKRQKQRIQRQKISEIMDAGLDGVCF